MESEFSKYENPLDFFQQLGQKDATSSPPRFRKREDLQQLPGIEMVTDEQYAEYQSGYDTAEGDAYYDPELYELDEDSLLNFLNEEEQLDEKSSKSAKRKRRKKRKKKKAKKDACYHKVKSRYKVWPSAYASGALVKCRKVGAKNWGNKSKKNEGLELADRQLPIIQAEYQAVIAEKKKKRKKRKGGKKDGKGASSKGYSLRDWFKGDGWVQTGGKYDGKPCAKQPGQKTKPYCRDPDDRAKMSKKERDKRAAKKRREDPNPERRGKAKNVSQKKGKKKK